MERDSVKWWSDHPEEKYGLETPGFTQEVWSKSQQFIRERESEEFINGPMRQHRKEHPELYGDLPDEDEEDKSFEYFDF